MYFIDFLLKRFRDGRIKSNDNSGKINCDQFIDLVHRSTFYLKFALSNEDLVAIFKFIDTDADGWITYREYVNFIIKYLGSNCIDWVEEKPKPI